MAGSSTRTMLPPGCVPWPDDIHQVDVGPRPPDVRTNGVVSGQGPVAVCPEPPHGRAKGRRWASARRRPALGLTHPRERVTTAMPSRRPTMDGSTHPRERVTTGSPGSAATHRGTLQAEGPPLPLDGTEIWPVQAHSPGARGDQRGTRSPRAALRGSVPHWDAPLLQCRDTGDDRPLATRPASRCGRGPPRYSSRAHTHQASP